MSRPADPADIYRVQAPTDPRLSPDGRLVAFTVRISAPARDAYRTSIWSAPVDGSAPARQLTLGARADDHPRFSPDGRTIAFLSDRRLYVEDEPALAVRHGHHGDRRDREDGRQVHLLPLDGGEARRLTDLPRGVEWFAWSPDGATLAILTCSLAATREQEARRRGRPPQPKPGDPPLSDYRYLDRLSYMDNAAGFVDDRVAHLWLVDVSSGHARPLVTGPTAESGPAWSPDGRRIAFAANRRRQPDLNERSGIYVVDVATGGVTTIAGGDDASFSHPVWLPDGSAVLALGDRFPRSGYRSGIWRFAADGSDAGRGGGLDLLASSELKPDAAMNSDLTIGEGPRLAVSGDGDHVLFTAPVAGSMELWSVATGGNATPRRLTEDRHYLSGWDAGVAGGAGVVVAVRSTGTTLPEVVAYPRAQRLGSTGLGAPRRVSALNVDLEAEIAWVEPRERRWRVAGREIQGWLLPGGEGRRPLVLEIHGGPHTLYGWSPMLEWQILAGAGIGVLACNPRGSEGYGEAFNRANLGDWGDGPMADVIAGVDQAIADGVADPDRLGVTGGSYGGYLTNWIVGRTDRFRAAVTCRSVADMGTLFLTGDISGGEWATIEFGRTPWEDPGYFHAISPLSLARNIRTPLLIQHAERDLRTTVGQAEALFTVLRSLRRPVRFMRVPEETHGSPGRGRRSAGRSTSRRSATGSCTTWSAASSGYRARRGTEPAARRVGRMSDRRLRRDGGIPFLVVRGSHREVGRQVGKATADVLREAVAFDANLPPGRSRGEQLALAAGYRDATLRTTPWLVDELDGAAEAAGVDPIALFAASIEEIWDVRPSQATAGAKVDGRCSDLVAGPPATADGHIWVAHTNDLSPASEAKLVAIEWRVPGEPVVLSLGIGPWVSVGWNDTGLSLGGNELSPNDDRVGVPRLLMVREQLTARTLDQAVTMALRPDRASSYNTVFAHRDGGIVNVEGSATDAEVTGPSAGGTLAHTNHYVCDRMRRYEGDPAYAARSAVRLGRALELLDGPGGAGPARGSITPESMLAALSDHATSPSICRHEGTGDRSVTVFWCLTDVTAGDIRYGRGRPCERREAHYRFA